MATYTLDIRVTKKEIDKYGHVNYANYMQWYELGHLQLLEESGLGGFAGIEKKFGLRTFIVHAEIDYKQQVFANETIRLTTLVEKLGNTSFTYHQIITNARGIVSEAKMTAVFVNKTAQPTPIPPDIRALLS